MIVVQSLSTTRKSRSAIPVAPGTALSERTAKMHLQCNPPTTEQAPGPFAERWRTLVRECQSPQPLDWIKHNAERSGYLTPDMAALIERRAIEIVEERHVIVI